MKSKNLVFYAIIGLAGVMYAKDNPQLLEHLQGLVQSEATIDAPQLPEPTGADRTVADAVAKALAGQPEQARSCCQLWWGLADVLIADGKLISTTKQVRDATKMAGKLTFGGRTAPDSGVLSIVEAGQREALGGTPNRALSQDDRTRLVQYFRAIAWGAAQAQ
jgi:hypothetical protein